MGSLCDGEKDPKENFGPALPAKANVFLSQLPITQSGLYVSPNINDKLSKSSKPLSFTSIPEDREFGDNSLILAVGQKFNPKLFVRFYLIYSFYIAKYSKYSKETDFEAIFYRLAQSTHTSEEEKKKIEQFKEAYKNQKNEAKKDILVVNYFFSAKFIVENINRILLRSNDPKDIGHLIFPMARIFNGIKKNYQNTIKGKKATTLYIITQLNKQQKKLIVDMTGKECCFSFSIFMKGFTVENNARKQFNKIKKQNEGKDDKFTLFFTVNFPYKSDKLESKYDYGYYINPDKETKVQGDVLFNIMNSFKVAEKFSDSEYDLEYGYLPYVYYAKYTDRNPTIDTSSIRVFDICEAVSGSYLKSQSCLFRVIREGVESLKVSQSVISQQQTKNNKAGLHEVEVQNIINNYIDQSNFKEALALADQYKSSYLIRAKKLEVLYKNKQYDEAREWLASIGSPPATKQKKISEAEEIIEFITVKLLIEEGKKQKAKEKLKALHLRMIQKYETSYQVIGSQVILTLEELYGGGSKESPITTDIAHSQRQNKEAIQMSEINLRGISTTI